MRLNLFILISIMALNTFAKTNPNDSLTNNANLSKKIITYKIQIGAFFTNNYDSTFLNSLCCNLFIEENKTNTKFLIGTYYDIHKAQYALNVVQKKIADDAFIVPYVNNKRVTFKDIK